MSYSKGNRVPQKDIALSTLDKVKHWIAQQDCHFTRGAIAKELKINFEAAKVAVAWLEREGSVAKLHTSSGGTLFKKLTRRSNDNT